VRSLNRVYLQNETSITVVMGNVPFLDPVGAVEDLFALAVPQYPPSSDHQPQLCRQKRLY